MFIPNFNKVVKRQLQIVEAEQPEDVFSIVLTNQRAWRCVPWLRADLVRGGSASRRITVEAYEASVPGSPSF